MKKLELEFRDKFIRSEDTIKAGNITIMMTPCLDDDYWVFRIKLHLDQSMVAFPKFGTIGIGFAQEKDWNTNLPYGCQALEIYNHIKVNKKYKEITKKTCIEAIEILKKACKYYQEHEEETHMVVNVNNVSEVFSYVDKLRIFMGSK
jgi:hypothetical protein